MFFYLLFCELNLYLQPTSHASTTTAGMFPVKSAAYSLPFPVTVLQSLVPRWLPYQCASFLRQFYITLSIAMTRILPALWPSSAEEANNTQRAYEMYTQKLWMQINRAEQESTFASFSIMRLRAHNVIRTVVNMLKVQLVALQGPPTAEGPVGFPNHETVKSIREAVENHIIGTTVRSHPMLASFWKDAVLKFRSATTADRDNDASTTVEQEDEDEVSPEAQNTRSPTLPPMEVPPLPILPLEALPPPVGIGIPTHTAVSQEGPSPADITMPPPPIEGGDYVQQPPADPSPPADVLLQETP